jgi:hypothetical protein
MSSDYDVLCVSHTPAIRIEIDEGGGRPETAIEVVRTSQLGGHPNCDLLVGRWSGALIEIACPGMNGRPGDGQPHFHAGGWHRDAIWADAGLLHVAAVAVELAENDVRIEAAVKALPMCWTPDRLRSLAERLAGRW